MKQEIQRLTDNESDSIREKDRERFRQYAEELKISTVEIEVSLSIVHAVLIGQLMFVGIAPEGDLLGKPKLSGTFTNTAKGHT